MAQYFHKPWNLEETFYITMDTPSEKQDSARFERELNVFKHSRLPGVNLTNVVDIQPHSWDDSKQLCDILTLYKSLSYNNFVSLGTSDGQSMSEIDRKNMIYAFESITQLAVARGNANMYMQ